MLGTIKLMQLMEIFQKTLVTKLIPTTMWKTIDLAYHVVYLNSPFVEDTLKDQW